MPVFSPASVIRGQTQLLTEFNSVPERAGGAGKASAWSSASAQWGREWGRGVMRTQSWGPTSCRGNRVVRLPLGPPQQAGHSGAQTATLGRRRARWDSGGLWGAGPLLPLGARPRQRRTGSGGAAACSGRWAAVWGDRLLRWPVASSQNDAGLLGAVQGCPPGARV